MKHKLNGKGQVGTIADTCKIADHLMSSQPIAKPVSCGVIFLCNSQI